MELIGVHSDKVRDPVGFFQMLAVVVHHKIHCWDVFRNVGSGYWIIVCFLDGAPEDGGRKIGLFIVIGPVDVLVRELEGHVLANPMGCGGLFSVNVLA